MLLVWESTSLMSALLFITVCPDQSKHIIKKSVVPVVIIYQQRLSCYMQQLIYKRNDSLLKIVIIKRRSINVYKRINCKKWPTMEPQRFVCNSTLHVILGKKPYLAGIVQIAWIHEQRLM